MKRDNVFLNLLIEDYQNGMSLTELNHKYNTDAYYQFKKHNVPRREHGEQHSISRNGCYKLNWLCESVSNETEAYILGLLFADGWICR